MKRFLVTLFIFFTAFFLIEKLSWYFINNAAEKEYDRRLEYVINGNFNKDIIIIGSSRGANNIMACQLEKETGFSSYNLSYRGVDITYQNFVLKTYFKFNKPPKKVLLFLDDVHSFKESATLSFRYDRLYPLSKYNYINDELISRGKRSFASNLFGLLRLNRKDFSLEKKKVLSKNILTDCGSMLNKKKNIKSMIYNKELQYYTTDNELTVKLDAYKSIQNLCEMHNVELVTIFSPNYKSFNSSFLNRYKKIMSTKNRVMVYDTLNPIYKEEKIYSDSSHLLKSGAKIFTSEISNFLLNH